MKKIIPTGEQSSAQARSDLIYYVFLLSLILVVLLFLHPAYSANDDFAMMSIASGAIDGIPDAHLVFTNSLIGEALKSLYILERNVNWYTAYLLATAILSQFALLRAVLKVTLDRTIKVIALSVLLIFTASFLILFNFTTIAIVACFSGFCLLFVEAITPSGKSWFIILGVLLVVLGGMIRIQSLLYTAVLVVPILILFGRERRKRIFPWLACLVILISVTVVYDNVSYSVNSEWKSFRIYNQERGEIHSTAKMAFGGNDSFLTSIGWNKAAYSLFDNWIFIDEKVFTLKSFEAINAAYSASIHTPVEVAATFGSLVRGRWLEVALSLAVTGLSIYTSFRNRSRMLVIAISIPVYISLVNLLVAAALRMVDNIFFPSLFILIMLQIGLAGVSTAKTNLTRIGISMLGLALVVFTVIKALDVAAIARQNIANELRVESISESVQRIGEDRNAALVVLQASSFPDIWISAYSATGIPFDYLPTGWLINSPPYRHILNSYGINNAIDAIGARSDVLYLGGNQEELINYLDQVKNIYVNAIELKEFEVGYKGHKQIYLTRFQEGK